MLPASPNKSMSVTREDGGRLNAFAQEPEIEVVDGSVNKSIGSRIILVLGVLVVLSLIAFTISIS